LTPCTHMLFYTLLSCCSSISILYYACFIFMYLLLSTVYHVCCLQVSDLSLESSEHRSVGVPHPLLLSTKSANTALCGRCTVNKSATSDLVIKPMGFPCCVKRIYHKFCEEPHILLSGREQPRRRPATPRPRAVLRTQQVSEETDA
jgi:hypothetical protein